MVTRFKATLAASVLLYVPLTLAALSVPVVAFAQAGNTVITPGSTGTLSYTLTRTDEGLTLPYWSVTDGAGNTIAEFDSDGNTGSENGWDTLQTLAANATTYTNTGLTENTAYRYRVVAVVGSADVPSNESVATTLYGSTGYIAAYATSSSTIRVYWQPIVGATGYKIFRSTTPGAARLATTPIGTVTGESIGFYDDNGLTPETLYYYAVRAIKNGSDSAASGEDAHFPNANAIPWNSTPSAILSKARQVISSMHSNVEPEVIDGLQLRLAAPDGTIYDESSCQPLPRDGTYDYSTGTMTINGNVSPVNADFFSWQEDTPVSGKTAPNGQVAQQQGVDRNALGAIRRVRSTQTINESVMLAVTGVAGTFRIPRYAPSSLATQNDLNVGTASEPSPHLYIGFKYRTKIARLL